MTNIDKANSRFGIKPDLLACSTLDGILNKPEALEKTFDKENLKLTLDFNNL